MKITRRVDEPSQRLLPFVFQSPLLLSSSSNRLSPLNPQKRGNRGPVVLLRKKCGSGIQGSIDAKLHLPEHASSVPWFCTLHPAGWKCFNSLDTSRRAWCDLRACPARSIFRFEDALCPPDVPGTPLGQSPPRRRPGQGNRLLVYFKSAFLFMSN